MKEDWVEKLVKLEKEATFMAGAILVSTQRCSGRFLKEKGAVAFKPLMILERYSKCSPTFHFSKPLSPVKISRKEVKKNSRGLVAITFLSSIFFVSV